MQAKDKRKHFQYPFRTIPVDQGADIMWTKKKSKWRENSTKKTSPFLRRFFPALFAFFLVPIMICSLVYEDVLKPNVSLKAYKMKTILLRKQKYR